MSCVAASLTGAVADRTPSFHWRLAQNTIKRFAATEKTPFPLVAATPGRAVHGKGCL